MKQIIIKYICIKFNMSLSNLFSSIQNGQRKRILVIQQPKSKQVQAVLKVLQENGFVRGFRLTDELNIEILLKYKNQKPVINKITEISKSSKRVYKSYQDITNLLKIARSDNPKNIKKTPIQGVWVLSTSKGILSNEQAYKYNIGGELLCHVY